MTEKRAELFKKINSKAKEYLTKDRSGKGYICPFCNSGSGEKGTGLTSKDGVHFSCWSKGCITNASLIDIIGKQHGIREDDTDSLLKKACSIFHLDYPEADTEYQPKAKKDTQANIHNSDYTSEDTQVKIHNKNYTSKDTQQDFTNFYTQAHKHIEKTSYHRGLTMETLNRFNVGYVESWVHPKRYKDTPTPRLIIPTSKYSYLARCTRELTKAEEELGIKPKLKAGKIHFLNIEALKTAQKPIVLVEGEIDALSIIDVGGEAIALGSTAYIKLFLSYLEENRITDQSFIIALDNDKVGQEATETLKTGLESLGLAYTIKDICSPHKDANEALLADREGFTERIKELDSIKEAELEAKREALKSECAFNSVVDLRLAIEKNKNTNYYPTGYPSLDRLLDGGLYPGLYIVGAISSLGKTTLCLNIADNIAKSGTDVLIFSLEMARYELMAKSISKLTYTLNRTGDKRNAKTTRGILTGSRYENYNSKEKALIDNAFAEYADKISEHIYITEGMGNVSVEHIANKVMRHKEITGKAPVVIIDYLQIIQPADTHATDKQNTDLAVTALKRLSRNSNIPVLAISSFNRDNYTLPVNFASFKESGAIEYSSDVLIGLQYDGMDYRAGETDKQRTIRISSLNKTVQENAKNGMAQSIQVKILKNRNGSKGSCVLHYIPMFNYYYEEEEPEDSRDYEEEDFLEAREEDKEDKDLFISGF